MGRSADSNRGGNAEISPAMGLPKWKSDCPASYYCQVANQQDFTEGAKGVPIN